MLLHGVRDLLELSVVGRHEPGAIILTGPFERAIVSFPDPFSVGISSRGKFAGERGNLEPARHTAGRRDAAAVDDLALPTLNPNGGDMAAGRHVATARWPEILDGNGEADVTRLKALYDACPETAEG